MRNGRTDLVWPLRIEGIIYECQPMIQLMNNASLKTSSLKIPGGTMHYYRLGCGKKHILMLHGRSENGLCWLRTADKLKQNYTIIMPDGRGHGLTRAESRRFDLSLLVEDYELLIEHFNFRELMLAGHSMGAGIAAILAGRYPGIVRKLVLLDPPWLMDGDYLEGDQSLVRRMRRFIEHQRQLSMDSLAAFISLMHPAWQQSECRQLAQAWQQMSLDVAISFNSPVPVKQWQDSVCRIKAATLLYTGDPVKGAIVKKDVVGYLKAHMSNLTHIFLPESGHALSRDCFDAYFRHLKSFLACRHNLPQRC
ncbi:MAG: alpha/beta fold hydrolase [Chitinivibrionales bacterium]|nr:alpha/beta fold hydrolase [Chitinivibrionales bacterium]